VVGVAVVVVVVMIEVAEVVFVLAVEVAVEFFAVVVVAVVKDVVEEESASRLVEVIEFVDDLEINDPVSVWLLTTDLTGPVVLLPKLDFAVVRETTIIPDSEL